MQPTDKNKQNSRYSNEMPKVIDAEYEVRSSKNDLITPHIQKRTELVPDRHGNKLLWIAIVIGVVSLILMIITWL